MELPQAWLPVVAVMAVGGGGGIRIISLCPPDQLSGRSSFVRPHQDALRAQRGSNIKISGCEGISRGERPEAPKTHRSKNEEFEEHLKPEKNPFEAIVLFVWKRKDVYVTRWTLKIPN